MHLVDVVEALRDDLDVKTAVLDDLEVRKRMTDWRRGALVKFK